MATFSREKISHQKTPSFELQMLLFANALCCSLYERNYSCTVTKIFTKFLPANNFCQLLRVTRKRSCTSAGNTQAQLHFRIINRGPLELATSPIAVQASPSLPKLSAPSPGL